MSFFLKRTFISRYMASVFMSICKVNRLDAALFVTYMHSRPPKQFLLLLHISYPVTHLFPMHSFSTPCFQGVEKGCIGSKWVNRDLIFKKRFIYLFFQNQKCGKNGLIIDFKDSTFLLRVLMFKWPISRFLGVFNGNVFSSIKQCFSLLEGLG